VPPFHRLFSTTSCIWDQDLCSILFFLQVLYLIWLVYNFLYFWMPIRFHCFIMCFIVAWSNDPLIMLSLRHTFLRAIFFVIWRLHFYAQTSHWILHHACKEASPKCPREWKYNGSMVWMIYLMRWLKHNIINLDTFAPSCDLPTKIG
jgi:hypothetical protein